MATIKHYKVVAALPSTLVADSIYLVRVGTGFDLYVTNSSGTIVAYPANYQAGSANLNALSGLSGAANKAPYFTAAGAMAVYDLTVFGRSVVATADAGALRTLLSLGTAATRAATTSPTDTTSERLWRTNDLVKQTSANDATAGRVLTLASTAGAFGLGATSANGISNPDDALTLANGMYVAVGNAFADPPYGTDSVYLDHRRGTVGAVQIAQRAQTGAGMKLRLYSGGSGGSWGPWVELWHSGNTLALGATPASARTAMGLDTAATRAATTSPTDTTSERLWRTNDLVKQTSANDATAGRVMLTGAGGWMGTAPSLTGNDYNNDSEYSGIVRNDNNTPAVNYPPQISANAPMAAINVRFNGSYGWQLGVQTPGASPSDANTRAFLRCEVNGSWSNWTELWHSGNFNPAAKQDAIAAGTTAQFWRGDKTWQDLAAAVRAAVLTGLSTVSAAAVSATDTVLAAIGKLQAQINGLSAASYTNLTLQSPYTWDAAGDAADYNQPSCAKVGDVVRLRGKVTLSGTHTSTGTVNVTTIATLPVGFRPLKRKAFQVFWDTETPLFSSYCLVFVNTNGTIVLVAPSSTQPYPFTEGHLPLDQIWFDLAP